MTGMSFRVPTADVSVVDLTAHLKVKTPTPISAMPSATPVRPI